MEMRRMIIASFYLIGLLFGKSVMATDILFDDFFLDKTMRLDYYHSGNNKEEHFAVDGIFSDGFWSSSKKNLFDPLNLGLYKYEVLDEATGKLLFAKGFCSIFGEWATTSDAKKNWGTFHESIRFPWPKKKVVVLLKKRDGGNEFVDLFQHVVDPFSRIANPAEWESKNKIYKVMVNGEPQKKVDIVILGDGYSKKEVKKFRRDSKRLTRALFDVEPFKARAADFNVWAVVSTSSSSGVSRPHDGEFRRTPLSVSYSAFDIKRYALTYDNKTIRNMASAVPYEFMVILINGRTYGGGGIYQLYTTVAADNKYSEYIMIHEMGHHLAGLADEYYVAPVAYEMSETVHVEPWELNITALQDKANLKWKKILTPNTPLPTPWQKKPFEKMARGFQKERKDLRDASAKEDVLEELFERQKNEEQALFANEQYKDAVGAFEGAGYMAKGLYRSSLNCIMFSRSQTFCPVCQNAISQVIDQHIE